MMIHRDFRVVLLGQYLVANICETNDALRVHRLSRTNNNLWKMANSQKKKKAFNKFVVQNHSTDQIINRRLIIS